MIFHYKRVAIFQLNHVIIHFLAEVELIIKAQKYIKEYIYNVRFFLSEMIINEY